MSPREKQPLRDYWKAMKTQNLMSLLPDSAISAMLEKVEKEKEKRALQTDLVAFTKYFFEARGDKFLENWHHYEIAEKLRWVEEGRIKNLLINMPPRYGKTELSVINWVAQSLARNPKSRFIHLSYSDDLALENSSRAKELVLSDEFQGLWPMKLKDDSQSKKKWYTSEGAVYMLPLSAGQ